MATILTRTHPLLTVPFSATTDFTVLADHCECFAQTLIEDDDPALKMALCGRLIACLTLLQPGLLDPIPAHLIESLTVDVPPEDHPRFVPECTQLCGYCLALTQTLAGQGLASETEKHLSWLRTAEGLKLI
ncbi:MAG TPA: hypothetical protein VJS14_12150 [Enterobacteriaceae bacterium]|nr:hypothetical protein [Enterobacteriaceae bacterium]